MEPTAEVIKKVTFRNASIFGFQLANSLIQQLEKDNVVPSQWPIKFPITIKQISKMQEVNNNSKIAKRICEAARAIWLDMRAHAVEIEQDMNLHPEFYEDKPYNQETHFQEHAWRHLYMDIEQISGSVFMTEMPNEEIAKDNVFSMLSPVKLKQFMAEFEDDYKNFIDEVRESIRNKKHIKASSRFELICLINTSTQEALKLLKRKVKGGKI